MYKERNISTSKKYELVDISSEIKEALKESSVKEGICQIYVPHSTCGIVINENYDPNICLDFLDALNDIIPEGKWRHDKIDNNAAAHIKASIIGPSETIPIRNGKLEFGTWQSPMLCDFDGPKERRLIINIIEKAD